MQTPTLAVAALATCRHCDLTDLEHCAFCGMCDNGTFDAAGTCEGCAE